MRWLTIGLCVGIALCITASCGNDKGAACGALGTECCAGRQCENGSCQGGAPGVCVACGGAGEACCDLNTCNGDGCCVDGICTPEDLTCPLFGGACVNASCAGGTCGGAGQACCTDARNQDRGCTADETTCAAGSCAVCGAAGEVCCDGECGPDLACDNGACRRCGGPGEPCCPGDICATGCCDQGNNVCVNEAAVCPSGGTCTNQACTCAGGELNCGNGCADVSSNVDQCGACNAVCNDTQFCTNSACGCRPGLVPGPGAACIDRDSNPNACGPSAVTCGVGTPICSNGTCVATCTTGGGIDNCSNACVNTDDNPLHCGGCDNVCPNDEVCVQGNCEKFDVAVGCTTCPCAACGGDDCCPYPNQTAMQICVGGGNGCPSSF